MWGKNPTAFKCTRSDCKHYSVDAEMSPCITCTCNRNGAKIGGGLHYESKDVIFENDRRTTEKNTVVEPGVSCGEGSEGVDGKAGT